MLKALVTSAAIVGLAAGSAFAGPLLMGDSDLDVIVAGKKPQSDGNGNGTDGGGDSVCGAPNCVWEMDHSKKDANVLKDYDSWEYVGDTTVSNNLTCVTYGYIDGDGTYVATNYCDGTDIVDP